MFDERQRLRRLEQLRILDTEPEGIFDDTVARAAAVFPGSSFAAISLIDRNRQWFKAIIGTELKQTPRNVAFCAHTIHGDGALVVEDATADPRFAGNILVTSSPGIRFYAGVSLVDKVGALCVIGLTPRKATADEITRLFNLATYVNTHLMLRATIQNLRRPHREDVGHRMAGAIASDPSRKLKTRS